MCHVLKEWNYIPDSTRNIVTCKRASTGGVDVLCAAKDMDIGLAICELPRLVNALEEVWYAMSEFEDKLCPESEAALRACMKIAWDIEDNLRDYHIRPETVRKPRGDEA